MDKGSSGYYSGTGGSGGEADLGGLFSYGTVHGGYPLSLHEGRQGKHIVDNNNYIPGRSIFFGTLADAQGLVSAYGGKGIWYPNAHREVVDFGRTIGRYISRSGESALTSWGTIHYSKTGTHIVPAKPRKVN